MSLTAEGADRPPVKCSLTGRAVLLAEVSLNSRLFIDGVAHPQIGENLGRFITPPLEPNRVYTYNLAVEGGPRRRVPFQAGSVRPGSADERVTSGEDGSVRHPSGR